MVIFLFLVLHCGQRILRLFQLQMIETQLKIALSGQTLYCLKLLGPKGSSRNWRNKWRNQSSWSWNIAVLSVPTPTPTPTAWSPLAFYLVLSLSIEFCRPSLSWWPAGHCYFLHLWSARPEGTILHPLQQKDSGLHTLSHVPIQRSVTEHEMGCLCAGCILLTWGRAWVFRSRFLGWAHLLLKQVT